MDVFGSLPCSGPLPLLHSIIYKCTKEQVLLQMVKSFPAGFHNSKKSCCNEKFRLEKFPFTSIHFQFLNLSAQTSSYEHGLVLLNPANTSEQVRVTAAEHFRHSVSY
ncbi:MAG: hypothetical protein PHV82_17820 [Victivallaceae bacterium]|nr:hypothetical protein [Victivallaceae bacterium]